uniref:Uncharacterized protein n=1 Tax=Amphimedon queenslandica TaxID=400682 RepID=A0A1X7U8A9_AMPQE
MCKINTTMIDVRVKLSKNTRLMATS